MFCKKNRYITRGVNQEVDIRLQMIMWELIDQLKEKRDIVVDYLQVFNIHRSKNKIIIEHRQEILDYNKVYEVTLKEINLLDKTKIFVIDSEEYSTMLLPEEY